MGDQALLTSPPPQLILITQRDRLSGERFFTVVEQALKGGVDAVLVREKKMDSARLLAFASRLRALTYEHQARLIVHSQADVAQAVAADGVHVAAGSIGELPAMRAWLQDTRMSLSASCHSAEELQRAHAAGADFALLSPVFATTSHPDSAVLGSRGFKALAAASPLPVIALGGIDLTNRRQLTGFGVAVIRAILDADEAEAAAMELCAGFQH